MVFKPTRGETRKRERAERRERKGEKRRERREDISDEGKEMRVGPIMPYECYVIN